jgi:hypothetical protein
MALFATAYLILALTSQRFLIAAIPLFAIAGATAAAEATSRAKRIALASIVVLPPLAYTIATLGEPPVNHDAFIRLATDMRSLPPGRVLGPWSFGHAIDVIGQKKVIIDNFGSMPDPIVFANAIDAMLVTRSDVLLRYAETRGVRYLVLPHPAYMPAMAATIGVDESFYRNSRLAKRTVWWRLYEGDAIARFRQVRGGSVRVWQIE